METLPSRVLLRRLCETLGGFVREQIERKLSLGPIAYFWSADSVRAFYEEVARWPVDVVYLGETVCAKRRTLAPRDWLALAERLTEAGKEVVLSTLALIEAESELAALERICGNGAFAVEANDMAAVRLLAGRARFVAGPHLNTYNGETLAMLAEAGAKRWVLPVELSRETLRDLQIARPMGLETEVLVHGRLPLAFSARCFTARAHNLPKDQCDFRCGDYPDGLALRTQEDEPLFTVNGTQIQSAAPCNLLAALDELDALGVDVFRIEPRAAGTDKIVDAFRQVMEKAREPTAVLDSLSASEPEEWCNGYWYGEPGMVWAAPENVSAD